MKNNLWLIIVLLLGFVLEFLNSNLNTTLIIPFNLIIVHIYYEINKKWFTKYQKYNQEKFIFNNKNLIIFGLNIFFFQFHLANYIFIISYMLVTYFIITSSYYHEESSIYKISYLVIYFQIYYLIQDLTLSLYYPEYYYVFNYKTMSNYIFYIIIDIIIYVILKKIFKNKLKIKLK